MTERPEGTPEPEAEPEEAEAPEIEPEPAIDGDIDDVVAEAADDDVEASDIDDEALEATAEELGVEEAEEAEAAEDVEEAEAAAAAAGAAVGPRDRKRGATSTVRPPSPSEIAVHVKEPWSQAFVLLPVAVFVGILLYGLLAGRGGLLTPIATPTAEPSVPASVSPSP